MLCNLHLTLLAYRETILLSLLDTLPVGYHCLCKVENMAPNFTNKLPKKAILPVIICSFDSNARQETCNSPRHGAASFLLYNSRIVI